MREIIAGDILAVDRGPYLHYAVYVGNGEVIHYAGENGDFKGEKFIHQAPMAEFLRENDEYFVLKFSAEKPKKTAFSEAVKQVFDGKLFSLFHTLRREKHYHLYSPEETVIRAKSRLGEREYNLITKNCEHFAIWCKTGVSESYQVNAVLEQLGKVLIPKDYT